MTKIKSILLPLAVLVVIVVLYLLLWPVPIDPIAWTPPPAPPLTGQYQSNTLLARLNASRWAMMERLRCGLRTGRCRAGFRWPDLCRTRRRTHHASASRTERGRKFLPTPDGRPLGLVFDPVGNLIVADAYKGLLSIAPNGTVSVLTTAADGVPLVCTNDLDVAADGTIYFTDASRSFPSQTSRPTCWSIEAMDAFSPTIQKRKPRERC